MSRYGKFRIKAVYAGMEAVALLLLLALLLQTSVASRAATVILAETPPSIIPANTTWTKASSPYILATSLLVPAGVTLTIQPGVVVKFDAAKAMQIDGCLKAIGTEAEPIVFTSNQPAPAPGNWINILFSDSSTDATYDASGNYLDGCILKYCTIEYGGGNNLPAVKASYSSLYVDHCTISHNACTGLFFDQSSFKITYNSINHNSSAGDGGGIYIANNIDKTGIISDNSISYNIARGGCGIYALGGTTTINNNTISNNSSLSSGSTWGGGICFSGGNYRVVNNIITNNHTDGNGGGIMGGGPGGLIHKNTVSGNSAAGKGGGVYCSSVSLAQNVISNNSADLGGAIYCNASNTNFISHNDILNNQSTNSQSGAIHLEYYYGNQAIKYNYIYNNNPYDIYNKCTQGTTAIDATRNWWGTTDEAQVRQRIYDWFDDGSLGIVNYAPLLHGPALSAPANFTVSNAGGTLNISWNAVAGATGYKVYYNSYSGLPYSGTNATQGNSPIDVGNVTSTNITGLYVGTVYYLAITAYDEEAESWYSDETSAAYYNPLIANFSANIVQITSGSTVYFNNQSSGGLSPCQYEWDFNNDGSVDSTVSNPSYVYTSTGTYTVFLRVTDSAGNTVTKTRTNYITVNPGTLHHIAVTPSRTAIVSSSIQQFTAAGYDQYNNAISGLNFTWSVANGGGTINSSGLFTAGASRGVFTDTVVVQSGSKQGKATVVIGTSITATSKLEGGLRNLAGMNIPLTAKLYNILTTLDSSNILNEALVVETFSTVGGQIAITNRDMNTKTVTFQVGGLPTGAFHVALFSPGCLVNLKQNITISQGLALDFGTLLAGNADDYITPVTSNQTQIFGSDFNMLLNDYLQQSAGDKWNNGRCDFDRNGQVTSIDFSLLIDNYTLTSPQVIP